MIIISQIAYNRLDLARYDKKQMKIEEAILYCLAM